MSNINNEFCSDERSIQILISLLKQHNIRRVVASPGATNITFVASLQHDPFFEIYSSVDERSAAYIACGIAAESGEPVVLSCTGATASRNYVPGLTEAYYRKLPVLAVTSTQDEIKIGHMVPQVIDRSCIQNDIAVLSEHIPVTNSDDLEWSNTIKLNRAILALKHHGGGPVHVNLTTSYSRNFSVQEYPSAKKIERICSDDEFPKLPKGKIAIFIGNHRQFTETETDIIDEFCKANNAIVVCDHTSGYRGKYKILLSILMSQEKSFCFESYVDLLIHIGEISGGYITLFPKEVWRVNPDGELRDYYRTLSHVFEMDEMSFFWHYSQSQTDVSDSFLKTCRAMLQDCWGKISSDIPFSNVWMASQLSQRIPDGSILHLGILNTLRSWNLFDVKNDVAIHCNTGGFGIDGCVSTLIGASLVHPEKLYFGIVGDLAFFYDMNSIGNRHVGKNLRLLIVNNGKGTEFRNYRHDGALFGDEADKYIAAAGHYGNKSPQLVKHYAKDLGYRYLSASNKDEFFAAMEEFVDDSNMDESIVFEVFTTNQDESDALKAVYNTIVDPKVMMKSKVKKLVGENTVNMIKKILK